MRIFLFDSCCANISWFCLFHVKKKFYKFMYVKILYYSKHYTHTHIKKCTPGPCLTALRLRYFSRMMPAASRSTLRNWKNVIPSDRLLPLFICWRLGRRDTYLDKSIRLKCSRFFFEKRLKCSRVHATDLFWCSWAEEAQYETARPDTYVRHIVPPACGKSGPACTARAWESP